MALSLVLGAGCALVRVPESPVIGVTSANLSDANGGGEHKPAT
jgi:hypothetical protein